MSTTTEAEAMCTTAQLAVRELNRRTTDGIDVRLLWSPQTNRISVALEDGRAGESFKLEVDAADALAAFRHPYAYANHDHGSHALAAQSVAMLNSPRQSIRCSSERSRPASRFDPHRLAGGRGRDRALQIATAARAYRGRSKSGMSDKPSSSETVVPAGEATAAADVTRYQL
jgi:hypothetical protein